MDFLHTFVEYPLVSKADIPPFKGNSLALRSQGSPVRGSCQRQLTEGFFYTNLIAFCWKLWYCGNGAASNGRRPRPFLRGQLLTPDFTEGGDCMVTYSELFQFVMMLTAVIALILQVCNYKKK